MMAMKSCLTVSSYSASVGRHALDAGNHLLRLGMLAQRLFHQRVILDRLRTRG
jgi:hypothetical protein